MRWSRSDDVSGPLPLPGDLELLDREARSWSPLTEERGALGEFNARGTREPRGGDLRPPGGGLRGDRLSGR